MAPQARCHHLTTEELLQQQIDDLRMLLEMKDNLCRNTDERGTMLQDALVDAEQRAATAEATAEKLEAENRVHTTRISTLEHELAAMQQEQRNLQGYAQKLQMLVQELQRGKAQRTQSGLVDLLQAPIGEHSAPQRLALSVANSTAVEAPETPDNEPAAEVLHPALLQPETQGWWAPSRRQRNGTLMVPT